MLQEFRVAIRVLVKSPTFVVIAVATLALAIGANTAVFSLVNALLIRPLPYRTPEQLVLLLQHFKTQNLERIPVSPGEFVDYESRNHSFDRLGAFGYTSLNLSGSEKPERLQRVLAMVRQAKALAKSDRIAVDVDPTSLL